MVSVRGEAIFTWKETGVSWDEVFTYVLVLITNEDNHGDIKVQKYHVWADTAALYLATIGQKVGDIPPLPQRR